MQPTLGRPGCELYRSRLRGLLSANTCAVSHRGPEPTGVEGQLCVDVRHFVPGTRAPVGFGYRGGCPGTKPLRYQGQLKVWGSQKLCRVFLGGREVSTPNPGVVQRPTALYEKLD